MYAPSYYIESDHERIWNVIRENGFATVINAEPQGLLISHLPLLLQTEGVKPALLGHCARANEHWKAWQGGAKTTILFQGPHSYISPAWYQPKDDNVPTWDYIAVHIQGTPTLIHDPEAAYVALSKTVQFFENSYQTGWSLPETPNAKLLGLLRGIVVFEFQIESIQAKFKLSQKQNATDRNNVIQQLSMGSEEQKELAKWF